MNVVFSWSLQIGTIFGETFSSTAKGLRVLDLIGISQFSTLRWSFFQDVMKYSAAGCSGIGVWREKVAEIGLDEAADLLCEMKLQVTSLSWCGGFTGSDGESFRSKVDDALEAIAMAAGLRTSCLVLHPGSLNGHIRRHARRLLEDALKVLIPVAEDYGVRLALEPMPESCWTMLDGIEATRRFCEMYSPSQLGLVWDLSHLGTDSDAWSLLPSLMERIEIVQLADYPCRSREAGVIPFGRGEIPVRDWMQRLLQLGYRGPWEVEHAAIGSQPEKARHVICEVQQMATNILTRRGADWPSSR